MSQQTISTSANNAPTAHGASEHGGVNLGALLCWAVVFADIGTSVYYVPGILYGQFGHLGGIFVALTMAAFVLLALKYAEVSVRFPEGGGVVTVSARALNPWIGALGGMFILVDYFLTAAISSLSGLQYLQDVFPGVRPFVLITTIVVLVLLGVLNWWGIKESASVSLVIAIAAFISDIVIILAIAFTIPLSEIVALIGGIFQGSKITPVVMLTGFAGAFLAFSGLESISQLSPVMKRPRSRTVTIALTLVILTVGFTSPLLTLLATTLLDGKHNFLLPHALHSIDPNQFISQLGQAAAGPVLGVATAVIASALLIFASNTAIIGTYHVFLALSHMSFFPKIVEKRDPHRQTPIISIALATAIPIAILLFANGQIDLLGQLYAFGLLGAFSLTCVAVDVLRVRALRGGKQISLRDEELEAEAAQEGRPLPTHDDDESRPIVAPSATARALSVAREAWRHYWPNINLVLGIITTLLVVTAWVTNLVSKRDATIFGGSLTVVGMTIAILHYRYQTREGRANIQPTFALSLLPNSVLAVVRAGFPLNTHVVESAFRQAHGRQVILLYLTDTQTINPGFLAISDQAMHNDEAQDLFRLARRLGGPTAQVFYKIGTVASAAEIWRVSRSREVVCDVDTATEFVQLAAPVYIRYQRQGKDTVAHIIMRKRGESALPGPAPILPAPATPADKRSVQAARYNDTAEVNDETWVEEFRDFDPRYADSRRPLHRNGATTGPRPQPIFADPPRPDHKHDGDTEPRYPVKIKDFKGPQLPPVIEPPRPAPLPRSPQRISEPTPVEADDDSWLLNIDDVPYRGQNDQNDQNDTTGDH